MSWVVCKHYHCAYPSIYLLGKSYSTNWLINCMLIYWRFQNGGINLLGRYYKWGKLVSYSLNNAAKTCLYGLKISENIEIGHFFQSRAFFHLSSNLHTSCLSAFDYLHENLHLECLTGFWIFFWIASKCKLTMFHF